MQFAISTLSAFLLSTSVVNADQMLQSQKYIFKTQKGLIVPHFFKKRSEISYPYQT